MGLPNETTPLSRLDDDELHCAWEDEAARSGLIDTLARDGHALVLHLEGKELQAEVLEAVRLLAQVLGQDLEIGEDGRYRIAQRVAENRIISTVDPEARHGHKTSARGFDGFKGHVAIDPVSELVTGATATAANVGDARVAQELIEDLIEPEVDGAAGKSTCAEFREEHPSERNPVVGSVEPDDQEASPLNSEPRTRSESPGLGGLLEGGSANGVSELERALGDRAPLAGPSETAEVYEVFGDASYGAAELVERLDHMGLTVSFKVQPPSPPRRGFFAQDAFRVDRDRGELQCPAGATARLFPQSDGSLVARFESACDGCPLRDRCCSGRQGRQIRLHPKHDVLERHRTEQKDQAWRDRYRSTRPKVERKIAHLMRRRHGGRRARVRGLLRVRQDFVLLAASVNLARLAVLEAKSD